MEIETAKQDNKCWKCFVKYFRGHGRGSRCSSDTYVIVIAADARKQIEK